MDALSDACAVFLYNFSQVVLGQFLPESIIFAIGLVAVVIAITIEGFAIYIAIRWYIRKSVWTLWLKTTFPKLFQNRG